MTLSDEDINRKFNVMLAMIDELRIENGHLREEIALRPLPKPYVPPLPDVEDFPDLDTLTQIKGQRFVNPPGKGVIVNKLKLGFWTCEPKDIRKYPNGTITAFEFAMYSPKDTKPKEPDSRLAQAKDALGGSRFLGFRTFKKAGTKQNQNQVIAILENDSLMLWSPEWSKPFMIADPAQAKRNGSEQAPHEVWTWKPSASNRPSDHETETSHGFEQELADAGFS